MSAPDAWLEFPSGDRFFILEPTTTFGRAPTNRVVIATERVSRSHAVIRKEADGSYQLMDLGSSNGTFVNGQRVQRPLILRNGWIIEMGLQKITFRTAPVIAGPAANEERVTAPCWLLGIAATVIGCRTPGEEDAGKTFESWNERAQRLLAKYRARTMRARDEGLMAYWPVQSMDTRAATVAAALRSLSNVQRQNEEFRLSLHYGSVSLRPAPTGGETPYGPEVIFALQLDRLASTLQIPVLLTEAAREALANALPTRRLGLDELRGYRGDQRFYSLAESPAPES